MDNFDKIPKGIFDKVKSNKELFMSEFKEKLEEVFPSAVKDGIVDFEALLNEFGQHAETDEKEKYNMTWVGKKDAIRKANEDIVGKTLKYVPEDSNNPDTTQNLYIEGDNLEVLKLLRNSYYGKIKMIYIDPPYNTGNDFIYNDTFKINKEDYEKAIGDIDEYNQRLTASKKGSGRFHSAWLNMMYPRLKIAKELLKDDGIIFISIDENELPRLKMLCDEIFYESNFVADIIWQNKKGGGNDSTYLAIEHEYILCYAKNINVLEAFYESYSEEYLKRYKEVDEIGRYYWDTFKRKSGKQYYAIECPDGTVLEKEPNGEPISWLRSEKRFRDDLIKGDVRIIKVNDRWSVQFKQRMPKGKKPRSIFTTNTVIDDMGTTSTGSNDVRNLFDRDVFSNPKPVELIEFLMGFAMGQGDIALDFFAGSATLAESILNLNVKDEAKRKFILVQLQENLDNMLEKIRSNQKLVIQNAIDLCDKLNTKHLLTEISKERIRRAGEKILEENKEQEGIENLDVGFKVFKVADTNIRWISNTLSKNISMDEYRNDMSLKDQLDFNPHFTDIDVVYEMMLKRQDIELTERIDKLEVIGDRTYLVGYTVLVCLEEEITEEMVKKISEIDTSLSWIVFRDSAFGDDINLKTNTMNLLRTLIKEKNPKSKNQKILWI
ncbi:site-specific DNA-methyltransferase [Clostridium sporogenes]